MANTAEMAPVDPPEEASTSRVSMPKNTVPVIRAQFRPLRFIRAIHTHRPTPMMPITMMNTIETVTRLLMWAVV